MSRTMEQKRREIADSILFSREVQELLNVSRERINQFVQDGRITPIRKGVYLKDEILQLKKQREEKGLQ